MYNLFFPLKLFKKTFEIKGKVYNRNEPANITRVAECVSNLMGVDIYEMTEAVYNNTSICL
jgi:Tat protein secretion system quality control protein TatD with DNase activity